MHFERFRDHDYLGAWDFEDGEITAVMDRVEQGLIEKPGKKAQRVPLLYLHGFDRPMVLNATNGNMIKFMYGSSDVRTWPGKPITITTGLTTDTEGHPCLGIRISPRRPEMPSTPESDAERIAKLEAELARAKGKAAAAPPELSSTVPATVDAEFEEVPREKVA